AEALLEIRAGYYGNTRFDEHRSSRCTNDPVALSDDIAHAFHGMQVHSTQLQRFEQRCRLQINQRHGPLSLVASKRDIRAMESARQRARESQIHGRKAGHPRELLARAALLLESRPPSLCVKGHDPIHFHEVVGLVLALKPEEFDSGKPV